MNDSIDRGAQDAESPSEEPATIPPGALWKRLLLLTVIAGGVGFAWFHHRAHLNLHALAAHESKLQEFGRAHPAGILIGTFVVYVTATAFSLPTGTILTLGLGWLCKLLFDDVAGFVVAFAMVSFASTAGATLAFLGSRYLFRDSIRARFGEALAKIDGALEREGPFYLFTLRLTPVVPFFVINLVMGLTPIRARTFWWVSQVGMLPGTAVYVFAGNSAPSLQVLADNGARGLITWPLATAFVLLGLFPLVTRWIMQRLRPATNA